MKKINRGQIWDVNLDPTLGAEIKKKRPCVVVNSNHVGQLPLKIVVPITEWRPIFERHLWLVKIRPTKRNGLTKTSAADAFQVKSLSIKRFVKHRGVLAAHKLADIAAAIAIVIEIP